MAINKFNSEIKPSKVSVLPLPNKFCSSPSCKKSTEVISIVVQNEKGVRYCDSPDKYLDKDQIHSGYEFIKWVTKCGDCHLIDLYAAGKSRWCGVPGMDVVYAKRPIRESSQVEIEKCKYFFKHGKLPTEKDFGIPEDHLI